jgi:hypothetical protein
MSKKIIVHDSDESTSLNINPANNNVVVVEPRTRVVTINGSGPRGPKGADGAAIFIPTGSSLNSTNNFQITGSLFATTFFGDGNGLYNIPTSSIVGFNSAVSQSIFPFKGKAEITGSIELLRPNIISGLDFFIIRSGSFNALTVTSDGVLKLGEFDELPAPIAGGLAYSQANFWVGME